MVDPTTANTSMSVPIRGSDVGTWDIPVNGNTNIIDAMFGSVTTIAPTSAAITLTSSQAQVNIIRLTGTLTSNVAITLPGIYKFWTVDNQLVNSPSSFAVTFVSTSGTSIIGAPPGTQDIFYDGTNVKYRNLGRVGEYWDYAASAVPTWVTASTKPPYLNCNGTTFSSATYPILANLLGTTTLPDSRGGSRYALNSGTGRMTTAGAGIDGNTIFARAAQNGLVLTTAYIPTINSAGSNTISVAPVGRSNVPGTNGPVSGQPSPTTGGNNVPWSGAGGSDWTSITTMSGANTISVQFSNGSPSTVPTLSPGYVGGITMIRAE